MMGQPGNNVKSCIVTEAREGHTHKFRVEQGSLRMSNIMNLSRIPLIQRSHDRCEVIYSTHVIWYV